MAIKETEISKMSKLAVSRGVKARDVAEAAGVSVTTVSLGLRDSPLVSPRTRTIVKAMAAKMNYRPQAAGRAMRRGRTHTIGMLFAYQPIFHDYPHGTGGSGLIETYSEGIQGVGDALMRHNYHMSFVPLPAIDTETGEALMPRMFLESSVDGVLVFQRPSSGMRRMLEDIGARYVVLDDPPQEGVFSVSVDEARVAEMAVEHLVQQGHKRIAYITERPSALEYIQLVHRVEQFPRGYTLGMAKARLPAMPGWDSPMSALEYLEYLWKQDEKPTALIAYDARLARRANAWLIQQGLSVPGDVSVMALHHTGDNPDYEMPLMPALTCKANQQVQMAEIAVEQLVRLIGRPDEETPKSVVLDPEWVVRESSGPCR